MEQKKSIAEKYRVLCPVCGKALFSTRAADIEDMCCPKCKSVYYVKVSPGNLLIREMQVSFS